MFRQKSVRLGVCPLGKFVFSHTEAVRQKNLVLAKLVEMGVETVDLEGVVPEGVVRQQEDAERVAKHFRDHEIDALFLPHCNFGTEGVAGVVARRLGVPTLLWGPRDEGPAADGSRLRDSLCGCFASSKVLNTLSVSYRYLENCHVSDAIFEDGLRDFLGSVGVAKALRTARIGQIGTRIDFFWSTIIDEADLLDRFGVEVVPFDMVEVIEGLRKRRSANDAAYRSELRDLGRLVDLNSVPDDGLLNSLALRDEMFELAERHGLDALALQSFNSIQDAVGEGFGLGVALAEERIPISAETDIHGALSSVMIEAAAASTAPSFFPEFTARHPENDNAVLLWHASAPISLRHPDTGVIPILPPWILEGLPATSLQFQLKPGDVTVCRFDGIRGEYRLGVGEGRMVPGPKTREVYGWMEVGDWPSWERRLIEGPYVHHCSAVYGRYADVLARACEWVPGLTVERFDA